MFDAKFIAGRKRALLAEKRRLESEIAESKKFEEYGTSQDDSAQEVQSFEEHQSVKSNLEPLLAEVKVALAKIDDGTYGRCAMGPEEIERERLEAFPAAALCMKHQKGAESRAAWWKPWTWRC